MRSTTAIPKAPCSGPGQFLTLVGYSSVLSKNYLKPGDLYQIRDLPHQDWPTPNRSSSLNIFCVGVIKRECRQMVLLLGAVCRCRENRYISTKCILFQIMHQNRAQNIIQCCDNNIWKQMCIKNLSYSTETYLRYNVQREKTGRKIHVSYISQIVPIPTE